ncbi:GAF domain-containing protein [Streptomyces katsurahamanus]|uniref:GAF domain-containing protein n=1 Tax=Streptomyces katsurahamanus TaxID=2577098 RepID=A0ABW9P0W1_9ACTN|nr:GAF domain-containing protein [Streptomyces katsurahamanus]
MLLPRRERTGHSSVSADTRLDGASAPGGVLPPDTRPGYPGDPLAEALSLLAGGAQGPAVDELIRTVSGAGNLTEVQARALEHARALARTHYEGASRRKQREAGLAALVDTARDLTLSDDLDELLAVIARRARLLLNVDMSYINFYDHPSGEAYVRVADGHATALTVGFRVPAEHGLGGDAWVSKAPFATSDYLTDSRIRHHPVIDEVVREEGLRGVMAIPLAHADTFFGVLYVADRGIRHFEPEETALMRSLADLATVAIEKADLLRQARDQIAELENDQSHARTDLLAQLGLSDSHSRMMEAVLAGRDLDALTSLAAELLGGPVLIMSPANRPLASHGDIPGLDETAVVRASLDAHATREPLLLDCGARVLALSQGQEHLGTVVVGGGGSGEPELRLMRLVSQTLSMALVLRRQTAVAESQVREEFFGDLLTDVQRPPGQLREKARRLALDLDQPHVVVVARPSGGSTNRVAVWASSYAYRMNGLKSLQGDSIALLLPGTDPSRIARDTLAELVPILGHPVTVGGAGPITRPEGIARAHREAVRCVRALMALGHTGASACVSDLGFLGMLLADDQDAEDFIQRTLGPVLEYDRQRSADLIRTLEAYFASGGSPTYAAETLHVHPNTVSRRLERITELIGAEWQKPGRALDLQLALRLQRISRTLERDPDGF